MNTTLPCGCVTAPSGDRIYVCPEHRTKRWIPWYVDALTAMIIGMALVYLLIFLRRIFLL